jgi:hypothetical protein
VTCSHKQTLYGNRILAFFSCSNNQEGSAPQRLVDCTRFSLDRSRFDEYFGIRGLMVPLLSDRSLDSGMRAASRLTRSTNETDWWSSRRRTGPVTGKAQLTLFSLPFRFNGASRRSTRRANGARRQASGGSEASAEEVSDLSGQTPAFFCSHYRRSH